MNLKGATFARTFEINQKLTDFYYSFDYDEFAFTECPHKTYAVTVLALDKEKIQSRMRLFRVILRSIRRMKTERQSSILLRERIQYQRQNRE